MQKFTKSVSIKNLRSSFRSNGMRSGRELAIERWLTSLGYNPEHSVREYGVEFDIYLRKQHIAFEFNGIAYHFYKCNKLVKGRSPKSKDYHRKKTIIALQNGILLYHFWDFEALDVVKAEILKILDGKVISDVNADKNPSLIAHCDCILKPYWILEDKCGFLKAMIPYNTKPLCWSERSVTMYEYYNSGYLCKDVNIKKC